MLKNIIDPKSVYYSNLDSSQVKILNEILEVIPQELQDYMHAVNLEMLKNVDSESESEMEQHENEYEKLDL